MNELSDKDLILERDDLQIRLLQADDELKKRGLGTIISQVKILNGAKK